MDKFEPTILSLRKVYRMAQAILPDEACGFIHRCGKVVLMRNVAPHPDRYFEMDPWDTLEAHDNAARSGCRISAVWHSHPSGRLDWSKRDEQFWVPNLLNVLVAPHWSGRWHAKFH